jgi:hypothetical protein
MLFSIFICTLLIVVTADYSAAFVLILTIRIPFAKGRVIASWSSSFSSVRVRKNRKQLNNPSCHLAEFGEVLTQRRRAAKEITIESSRSGGFALKILVESGQWEKVAT